MNDRVEINDNCCYAFPTNTLNVPFDDSDNKKYMGMTLRDYFAAQALPFAVNMSTTVKSICSEISSSCNVNMAARLSYQIADAMLLEKSKLGDNNE